MFWKKAKTPESDSFEAAERVNLPTDAQMTMLLAEEIPFLPSEERSEVYRALEAYDGPKITSQEQLPLRVRQLLDL